MSALSRRVFVARRRLSERWALLVLLGVWPLLAMGRLSGPALLTGQLLPLSVVTMFGLTVLLVTVRASAPVRAGRHDAWAELEAGLSLITAVYVLVAATGGTSSFLYPLVYALVSFLMVVHRSRAAAVAWVLAVGVLEVVVALPTLPRTGWSPIAMHLTFLGFFAAGNLLVLSSLVRRLRRGHEEEVAEALERMSQEARDFRLIASPLPPQSRTRTREEEEVRMAVAAVETIREQLFHNVDLLRTSLSLHSCALLWCTPGEDDGEGRGHPRLFVKEISSAGDDVRGEPALPSAGILTSVLTDPKPLRLERLAGRRVPPYYEGPVPITDLCVVPLMDGPNLRGLLCADRTGDAPFSEREEATLAKAAVHMLRVVEHERLFSAVERGKYEQEQFYRASELLGSALTMADVHAKTFAALERIAHHDLAVITQFDEASDRHTVAALDVPEAASERWRSLGERLGGLEFDGGRSLVGMAVKNRHYMPATGDLFDADTTVFDVATRLREAESLLVLPLVRGDQVLGAITLASGRERQYPPQTREMLRVISHQVAVSVDNARMYESMEQLATTDGLTGLTNHRSFQQRLAQLHDLCERAGRPYSLILTDIDHFKSINDTYGHPVGDQVLRRVAGILKGRSRRVDIVARYGGEEFVLVLPDTDARGAETFANDLREEIAAQVMSSEHGSFSVTISMGVAEFPHDDRGRAGLVEKADQALYFCKEHGRNCVTRYGAID